MNYKIIEGDEHNELMQFDEEAQEYRCVGVTDCAPDEIEDAVHIHECELEWQDFTLLETYENFGDENDRASIE